MAYLMRHLQVLPAVFLLPFNDSAHFIYGLYGIKHGKDSERGNPLPSQGFFYMHHSTDRIAHTTAFVTLVVEHLLEREMGPSWRISPITHHIMRRKEGNVLFYVRLYGVRHMVKDHSDSDRGNLLPPHGLFFLISSKGSFICTIPQTE